MLARYMGTTHSVPSDSDVTPIQLEEMLRRVCIDADAQLAQHPRMLVEHSAPGTREKYSCMDSSGSTAILALVTSQFVIVGNVGDSRAVLAVRPASSTTASGVLSSPFPINSSPRARGASAGFADEVKAVESVSTIENGHKENGDSLTYYGSGSCHLLEAVALSRDHKVTIPEEKERIIAAGAM